MNLYIVIVLVLLETFSASSSVISQKFPPPCPKSTTDYNKCFTSYFETIKPQLMKGLPEFGLPGLDPFDLEFLSLNFTLNDDLWFKSKLMDIHAEGLKQLKLKNLNFNPNTLEGEFSIEVPSLKKQLRFDSTVHMFGNLFQGTGSVKSRSDNIVTNVKLKLEPVNRSGVEYYTIPKLDVDNRMDEVEFSVYADDPENQVLIDSLLDYYKKNRERVRKMFKPMCKKMVEQFRSDWLEPMLSLVPAKYILPE